MNNVKTVLLLTGLTALFLGIGHLLGGQQGVIIAFVFALISNFVAYWFSDKIVLTIYGAKEIKQTEAPELHTVIQALSTAAGIPMPKVYAIRGDAPNAFATGRDPNHAAVAVTSGLMGILSKDELSGVIAHELAHVKNRDTLIQVLAATVAGAIMMIADMARFAAIFGGGRRDDDDNGAGAMGLLLMAIVAPFAAMIVQMAISRTREYHADETGAKICGKPLSLANALKQLENYNKRIPILNATPSTAHMFIVQPFSGGGLLNLFSTHPPVTERVKRLEKLAEQSSNSAYNIPKIIY
ncbi:MAG: zinc metalloprotease HtpX [Elusimicrobiota bacterium]